MILSLNWIDIIIEFSLLTNYRSIFFSLSFDRMTDRSVLSWHFRPREDHSYPQDASVLWKSNQQLGERKMSVELQGSAHETENPMSNAQKFSFETATPVVSKRPSYGVGIVALLAVASLASPAMAADSLLQTQEKNVEIETSSDKVTAQDTSTREKPLKKPSKVTVTTRTGVGCSNHDTQTSSDGAC
ncbi:hypothetical protein N9L47_11415 [Rhodobacteraceae bacterium]|nr:hypothetical protein [Paracoccaceae bacterium]